MVSPDYYFKNLDEAPCLGQINLENIIGISKYVKSANHQENNYLFVSASSRW